MNLFGHVVLLGWIPFCLLLYVIFAPRRAMLYAVIGGVLLLPAVNIHVPGIPAFNKTVAISIGVLLSTLIFNTQAIFALRPRLFDIPMLVFCAVPFASSISNGLGAYDGVSAVAEAILQWGLPYLIGRIYLTDLQTMHALAVAVFVGGLLYVPLCLFENRMSPKLHLVIYGIDPGGSFRTYGKFGILGYQPAVFLQNALQCTLFMGSACIAGVWLWMNSAVRTVRGFSAGWLAAGLIVATLLCKALGANVLWIGAVAALITARSLHTRAVVWMMILAAPMYMAVRASGAWSGDSLLRMASMVSKERAASLQTRIENEDALVAKALQRPGVGWGRWGRARIVSDEGRDVSLTDGLWVIQLGNTGMVGLMAMTALFLLPVIRAVRSCQAGAWSDARTAGLISLAMMLTIYTLDSLFNAPMIAIYMVAAGGLVGARLTLLPTGRHLVSRPQAMAQPTRRVA